jgi:two-component system chemotaxis response regulator CheY
MKKMVWMVDDDDAIRRAMRLMFKLLNYDLRDFSDGRILLSNLQTDPPPDLLFLDINMPIMNGMDILDKVRSDSKFRKLTVLIMSSESEDVRVEQAIRKGADGYVFKPVTIEELEMAIGTAVERRKAVLGA